ncbi:MAG: hypothetical protein OXF79_10300 [Chloroflexi bacterium]|nr:hypothetical protein [Chloroflexota bacterium]
MLNVLSGVGLTVAVAIFLASAVAVVFLGGYLAKYGDALASLTGWGRLFVGSILVALATSLPEVSNNITAVRIDNPQLALGDVLGSNMFNILTLGMVALLFGGKRFLQRVAPEQGYLILLAAVLTGLAVVAMFANSGVHVWQVGLSSIIILVAYLVGMWIVYNRRPSAANDEGGGESGITLRRAWIMFILVSLGVIVSGVLLAQSVDRIAHVTGVSSGVLGILAVALVTSMPEISATFAAARLGAADLGFAGVYGSCVFNITILAYADFFYRKGVVVNTADPEHYIAGVIALGLIIWGGVLLWGRNLPQPLIMGGLALMLLVTIGGAVWVALLGAPSH